MYPFELVFHTPIFFKEAIPISVGRGMQFGETIWCGQGHHVQGLSFLPSLCSWEASALPWITASQSTYFVQKDGGKVENKHKSWQKTEFTKSVTTDTPNMPHFCRL